jgi:hypothetical protein
VGLHLEDDVDAVAAGDAGDAFGRVLGVMIDDVLHSLRAHERRTGFRSGAADHPQIGGARELNRRQADAAARAVDQQPLAGPGARQLEERTVGAEVGDADRRSL